MGGDLTRTEKRILNFLGEETSSRKLIFLDSIFVQASLPHSDPGNVEHWVRNNGSFTLRISQGEITLDNVVYSLGIPYGSFSRLLLMWIITEALKNKSKTVSLGRSLRKFLENLNIPATGGKNGSITRLKEQLMRLIHCRIIVEDNTATSTQGLQFYLVEQKSLSWLEKEKNISFKDNIIELNDLFYNHIIKNSVPLDFDVIKSLKQSSFAIDIYVWLTYRVSYLKISQFVSWHALSQQMGGSYSDINNFRRNFLKNLKLVQAVYPDLNIEQENGGIRLYPSPTHISKLSNF